MCNKVFKSILLVLYCLTFLFLFACENKTLERPNGNETNEIANEESPIAKDEEFLNMVHLIRNNTNNTEMLVRGDGKILLTVMEPYIEGVGIIQDVNEKFTNYVYKTYYGEKLLPPDPKVEYSEGELSIRSVFYDRDGNEIGLTANSYGAILSSKNKIIYIDNDIPYDEYNYKAYDVNTKKTIVLKYRNVISAYGKVLMSTNMYQDKDEEIVVTDENLNTLKTIKGYSLAGTDEKDGIKVIGVARKVDGVEDNYKYNFLDENFDLIFDEDIDKKIWSDTFPVFRLVKDNMEFQYDFSKKQKVSEDKPYVEDVNVWREIQNEKDKYEDLRVKIQESSPDYNYVSVLCHGEDVLFFAYKKSEEPMTYPCDVYNKDLEKVVEFNSIDNQYDELGYFLVDGDTIYNTKLEVVKKLDTKGYLETVEKFDKKFYADSMNKDFSQKKDFTLLDSNFDPVFEHLIRIESYPYKDYLVVIDKDGTRLIDKDLKAVKSFSRKLDIKNWGRDGLRYKVFEDLDTGRMGIIDEDYNIVVDNMKDIEDLQDKHFVYQNGFRYGLMDYEGRVILSYPIFNTMREDAVNNDFDGDYVVKYEDYE